MRVASAVSETRLPACLDAAAAGTRDIVSAAERYREEIGQLLLTSGAVLLRGFEIDEPAAFEAAVRSFSGKEPLGYAGGVSPRKKLGAERVYTSTEYPPEWRIPLHNELSYSSRFPDHLYFCCFTESSGGGGTTLADSRRILRRISKPTAKLFKAKQIRYVRTLSGEPGSGYSWQDAFETDDRSEAELLCRRAGANLEWLGGCLRVEEVRPATAVHPVTGEEVWFNQADGFHISNSTGSGCRSREAEVPRLQAFFGDGSPICPALIEQVRRAIEAETVIHMWKKGDVLIVDNRLAAHGRMPFSGPRRVAVAMT